MLGKTKYDIFEEGCWEVPLFSLYASGVRQYIWNEGVLFGVSRAGIKKLNDGDSGGYRYAKSGGNSPQKALVGWEEGG